MITRFMVILEVQSLYGYKYDTAPLYKRINIGQLSGYIIIKTYMVVTPFLYFVTVIVVELDSIIEYILIRKLR